MEERRRDSSGTPPPPAAASGTDGHPLEQPTSRRRGGGQKRKSASINSVGSGSTPQTTSSKRQAREKPPAVPFPPVHMNGPCTRARLQPYNSHSFSEVAAVKSESEAREAAARAEEIIRASENWQALEAKIEADYEAIRSRDANVHVVPSHAGWFTWSKIHQLEELMLPSFFNGKSEKRSPQIYMETRNWIVKKFHSNPNEQIELRHLSEITAGDLDARQEVMEFLDYWGLINYHPFSHHEPDAMPVDVDADAEKDDAGKIDSLVEQLFKFETVQSSTPIVPRMNMAMPASSSGLFPESAVSDELGKSEEPNVEYHCNSCSADCSRKRYHCQKQADFDLCADCFNNGKFGSNMSPADFILMEPGEAGGASGGNWTDQETLLLLEAIELFRDNWNEIAEHVATKTKAQCILHFVQMPIEDAFLNNVDEAHDPPKETEVQASVSTESSDQKPDQDSSAVLKDAPQEVEKHDCTTNTQDSSCPMVISKRDEVYRSEKCVEVGESVAVKALMEAFEAVGLCPSPGEKLSFADAGNPVMALASFLVRLVDPNIATATVRSLLKAVAGNCTSEQLAIRHCFPLEDPLDDLKNLANSDGAVTETKEDKAHKDKDEQADKQEQTPDSVVNGDNSQNEKDQNKDSAPEEHDQKKDSASEDLKPVSSPSDNNDVKKPDEVAAHGEAQLASGSELSGSNLSKEQAPKDAGDSAVSASQSESQSKPSKELVDGSSARDASQSKEHLKDELMATTSEKTQADSLVKSIPENGKEDNSGGNKAEQCAGEKKESLEMKSDHDIKKLKNAAVTALSGAAVKAKFLAEQEEEEILKLSTMLIEKQLFKLETKLAFFHDLENVVMRVKEQLDRSKQRLFHERAQIIATRFGMSASARPNAQGMPPNRPGFTFPNSGPRPFMGMNTLRPPFPRPMMSANPTSGVPTPASAPGNSMQPNADR